MNRDICQTIIALQQLKIKDALIDRAVYQGPVSRFDLQAVSDIAGSLNASGSPEKIPRDSVVRAWQMAEEIMALSDKNGVKIFSRHDDGFPELLKRIQKPPLLLHVRGNADLLRSDCVAVIGTRAPQEVSRKEAYRISQELVRNGITVVSGLAKGIDAAAHEGALAAQGPTIAVLAHGLQMVYPAENRSLAKQIVENNGALVSEYTWSTPLMKWFLVDRDRIQSGLSRAVFVIETRVKGGTMHTVGFCEKQGRLLFVLNPPDRFKSDENFSGNTGLIDKAVMNPNIISHAYGDPVAYVSEKIASSSRGLTTAKSISDYVSADISCVREPDAFIVDDPKADIPMLLRQDIPEIRKNVKTSVKKGRSALSGKKPAGKTKGTPEGISRGQKTFD